MPQHCIYMMGHGKKKCLRPNETVFLFFRRIPSTILMMSSILDDKLVSLPRPPEVQKFLNSYTHRRPARLQAGYAVNIQYYA